MTSLHWQTSLQNRQCHALCTLGRTSKCDKVLRPICLLQTWLRPICLWSLHMIQTLLLLHYHSGSVSFYVCNWFGPSLNNYRPQRSCEGYVFTPVYQSFCSRGGFCLSACWLTTPLWSRSPRSRHPPGSRHRPGAGTPLGPGTPQEKAPPGSRRYASHWNAFLY